MQDIFLKILTFDLLEFVSIFFPKFKFSNSGCSLSATAAYTPVFTVILGSDRWKTLMPLTGDKQENP